MRAKDFISEDVSDLNQAADIVTALSLLHQRILNGQLANPLPTSMILRYIRNTGLTNIEYQDLITANDENEAMQELLANITPETVKFKTKIETTASNPEDVKSAAENPEEKVSKMADRALKRRQK